MSVRLRGVGQAQDPLGDDVRLHLLAIRTVQRESLGPVGTSATDDLRFHFAAVFWLML